MEAEIKAAIERDIQKTFDSVFGPNRDKYLPYNERTLLILKDQIRTSLRNAVAERLIDICQNTRCIYIDGGMYSEAVVAFLPLVFPEVRYRTFDIIKYWGPRRLKTSLIGSVKYAGEPEFHFNASNGTLNMDSRCIFEYAQKIKKLYIKGVIGDDRSECK